MCNSTVGFGSSKKHTAIVLKCHLSPLVQVAIRQDLVLLGVAQFEDDTKLKS